MRTYDDWNFIQGIYSHSVDPLQVYPKAETFTFHNADEDIIPSLTTTNSISPYGLPYGWSLWTELAFGSMKSSPCFVVLINACTNVQEKHPLQRAAGPSPCRITPEAFTAPAQRHGPGPRGPHIHSRTHQNIYIIPHIHTRSASQELLRRPRSRKGLPARVQFTRSLSLVARLAKAL